MNVLSFFDGMSCGYMALLRAGKQIDNYYASETKTHAIKVSRHNYKNITHLGDCKKIHYTKLGIEIDINKSHTRIIESNIDLFIGGSPCKGISGLNQNQDGLKNKESILFWEYVRMLKQIQIENPDVKFLLENTHGNKEATNIITETLGVNPISINSKLVSAQNRPRYYWTNIKGITQPEDKNITTNDVFDYLGKIIPYNRVKWLENKSGKQSILKGYTKVNPYPKSGCITANGHKKWNENYLYKDGIYRFLSISEIEKLQTVSPGFCDCLTYDEAYDVLGDGWTIDIITHILSFIK